MSKANNPSGIRIGVQEVTRLGMKENEMEILAEIIWDAVNERKSDEKLKQEVRELKENFNTIKYTFEECPAYDFPEIISKSI